MWNIRLKRSLIPSTSTYDACYLDELVSDPENDLEFFQGWCSFGAPNQNGDTPFPTVGGMSSSDPVHISGSAPIA
jgi:hypothetical protein